MSFWHQFQTGITRADGLTKAENDHAHAALGFLAEYQGDQYGCESFDARRPCGRPCGHGHACAHPTGARYTAQPGEIRCGVCHDVMPGETDAWSRVFGSRSRA